VCAGPGTPRSRWIPQIDSDLLDWRTDYSALSYKVVTLPDGMDKALVAYLDHFGLASGQLRSLYWP
jgi:hypothetical protein